MPFGRIFGLNVITRQPQCAADDVGASCQPAPVSPRDKGPEINQDRRRYTKGNDVRKRIELYTKLAGGMGEARRVAVYAVKYVGQYNEEHRLNVFSIKGGYDRKKAAHDVAGGE